MAYERDSNNDLVWDETSGEYIPARDVTQYTLTIYPTPSDATVTLTATGYTQSGNSITVDSGVPISWSVTKAGYVTKQNRIASLEENTVLNITLNEAVPIIQEASLKNTVYDIHSKAVLNQNTTSSNEYVYNWVGTLAEYTSQNIEFTHPDWVCLIIDDEPGTSANSDRFYTKTEVDTLISGIFVNLYPVGSLYFGTQSTCPLTTLIPGSTWELVASQIVIDVAATAKVYGAVGQSSVPGYGKYLVAQDTSFGQQTVPNTGGYTITVTPNQEIEGASVDVDPTILSTNVWRRTA